MAWFAFWLQMIIHPNIPQLLAVNTISLLILIESEPPWSSSSMLDICDPCWAASDGSPISIANKREQTGKQPVCAFDSTYSIFIARILLLFLFFFLVQTQHKPGEPADNVDRPPFLFLFWSHVWSRKYLWELMAVGSPQWKRYCKQQVCAHSCVPDKSSCVHVQRIILLKKKFSLCLWCF